MGNEADLSLRVPIQSQCRIERHRTSAVGARGTHFDEIAPMTQARYRVHDTDHDPRHRSR
jgi:hypothetical protein